MGDNSMDCGRDNSCVIIWEYGKSLSIIKICDPYSMKDAKDTSCSSSWWSNYEIPIPIEHSSLCSPLLMIQCTDPTQWVLICEWSGLFGFRVLVPSELPSLFSIFEGEHIIITCIEIY